MPATALKADEAWTAASLVRRIAAAMLDVLILAIPYALVSMVHTTLALLAVVLYGALLESSSRRATPGKHWCGIVAVPVEGGRLSFAQAFVRNAIKYAAAYFAGITYGASALVVAAPLFVGKRRKGLHDIAAKSEVRREPGQGLSDLAVGLLATVVPVLFAAGVLPLVMNPTYEAAARHEIARAIDSTHPQRARIAEFYAKSGRMPESLEEAGAQAPPDAPVTMSYRPGIMVVELSRMDARASPARLVFTANASAGSLAWKCSAEGIRKERLPAICRED
jgi:uncharacterized RDD family membrane protein YckC